MRATLVSRRTIVVFRLAVSTVEFGTTIAGETSRRFRVLTTAAVHASVDAGVVALVIVVLACRTSPAMRTLAAVTSVAADTSSSVVTCI